MSYLIMYAGYISGLDNSPVKEVRSLGYHKFKGLTTLHEILFLSNLYLVIFVIGRGLIYLGLGTYIGVVFELANLILY